MKVRELTRNKLAGDNSVTLLGFCLMGNAQRFNPSIEIFNPCMEAGLANKQSCNLTTICLNAYIKGNDLDREAFERDLRLITRIGSRQTTVKQWHPDWDEVQKRDRLLGVSMTGVMEAFEIIGHDCDMKFMREFFTWAGDIVRDEADKYHDYLGIPRSARVSLFKPEGTLSQLRTTSSGIHRLYAPYFIRGVEFSSNDALAKALLDAGLTPIPKEANTLEEARSWIFKFPIKTVASIRSIDEPAIAQLERYKLVQNTYVRDGHNTSVTVSVAEHEWEEVTQWVYDNWDYIINISFLNKFDPEVGTPYPYLPYIPCSKETYESMPKVELDEEELISLISIFEQEDEEYELEKGCDTGFCPTR